MKSLLSSQIEMVNTFAKVNKISKAKTEQFAESLLASIPKPVKVSTGKQGRPMLDKTSALHKAILEAVNNGNQGQRDAVTVRKVVAVDHPNLNKITFNNALQAMVKQGKIYHAGKAKTGSRGRQPFILSTIKPEGV